VERRSARPPDQAPRRGRLRNDGRRRRLAVPEERGLRQRPSPAGREGCAERDRRSPAEGVGVRREPEDPGGVQAQRNDRLTEDFGGGDGWLRRPEGHRALVGRASGCRKSRVCCARCDDGGRPHRRRRLTVPAEQAMLTTRFRDRREAGRHLARALIGYASRPDVLVLGLPRGGVPVASEVASALDAPLDVLVVRKLGVPGHDELAMGAVASGGITVFNRDLIQHFGISQASIDRVTELELTELARREQTYRGDAPPLDVKGRTVILVDDGLATGATMS